MKRSTTVPLLLVVYLGIMAYVGWPGYQSGETSPWKYFGGIAITLAVIVLLHFNLKKRDQYRRRRQAEADEMARKENENKNQDTEKP